jgi:hypothetical protein
MIPRMEQYTHLLIPSEPQFTPAYERVSAFLQLLAAHWNYEIDWNDKYIPGLRLVWTTGEPHVEADPKTGKSFMRLPRSNKVAIARAADIAEALEGNPAALAAALGCVVAVNGGWGSQSLPVTIPRASWPQDKWLYSCGISFYFRPQVVCTSDWWGADGHDPCQSKFGQPADLSLTTGRFTHPMSRRTVEVPDSGNARFWLGFSFSRVLIPHWPSDLALVQPELVRAAEDHFGVRFAQAGRGVG